MFEVMMEPPPRLIPVQNWLNLKHRDRVTTTRAVLLGENLFFMSFVFNFLGPVPPGVGNIICAKHVFLDVTARWHKITTKRRRDDLTLASS